MPRKRGEAEFIEKRSRFIGYCLPVTAEAEALAFIKEIRAKHRDASHNVYAWKIREGALCRHSDDGEPSGTAGMPLLDVFLKQDVTNFCAVATRYFGGVLLGAGGLTRAYSKCGVVGLEAAGIAVMRPMTLGRILLPYALYDIVLRALEGAGASGIEPLFETDVTLRFALPDEDFQPFCETLTEITAGRAAAEREGGAFSAT